ncbi:hypothetical protein HMPREF0580_0637 [Mobiluncus mulieris ATCC 35239]|uniref:Uncharacterized protein n=1 Tax=Mobiluncus mulieris ATCC 35239 TaxID=871571 RepID=E0QP23_9ACTO|nr:hypothetical protein HMPREF0580_0637 [Mobiluncus mulieris ATCC 35239]
MPDFCYSLHARYCNIVLVGVWAVFLVLDWGFLGFLGFGAGFKTIFLIL